MCGYTKHKNKRSRECTRTGEEDKEKRYVGRGDGGDGTTEDEDVQEEQNMQARKAGRSIREHNARSRKREANGLVMSSTSQSSSMRWFFGGWH